MGLVSFILHNVLCNPGVYRHEYSICVRPLYVLENGDVQDCYIGRKRKFVFIQSMDFKWSGFCYVLKYIH